MILKILRFQEPAIASLVGASITYADAGYTINYSNKTITLEPNGGAAAFGSTIENLINVATGSSPYGKK